MTMFSPRATRYALPMVVSLLLITMLIACGKKGPVRPKLASLPGAPQELRIAQQGDDFLVSWTLPEKNQDGSAAEDLRGFHIYRLVYNAAEGCPTCRDPEELVAALDLRHLHEAIRIGKRLYWRDAAVAPGTGHAYLIVPVTVGGEEGTSVGSFRAWQQPPPAPATLQLEPGERQVRLSWTPPATVPTGQQLLGYNLYRRAPSGSFLPVPLNAEPLREPRLTDFIGESGREAIYRVTTLTRSGDQVIESVPSAEAAATPQGAR